MLDKQELKYIADTYGTPSYVFDLEALKERVQQIRMITKNQYQLCYSIKANPFLIPTMVELVDKLEVCSPGELSICKKLNVPSSMIIYSGVNKEEADIHSAITYNVGVLTVESKKHMRLISAEAVKQNKVVSVLLRLNAGSQFGMSKEDLLEILDSKDYPNTEVVGIHYFVGTQRKKIDKQIKELEMLKEIYDEIKNEYHITLQQLEYGPGLSVSLFENDDFSDTLKPLKELHEELCSFPSEVTIEMGRFFATYCGSYISKVVDLKENQGVHYCLIDGGINHINYYGSMMGMYVPITQHISEKSRRERLVCLWFPLFNK